MVTDFVRRVGVEPADDMPNYGGHSGQFMLELMAAWVGMGFRRLKSPSRSDGSEGAVSTRLRIGSETRNGHRLHATPIT
jgi:hypothetical protein